MALYSYVGCNLSALLRRFVILAAAFATFATGSKCFAEPQTQFYNAHLHRFSSVCTRLEPGSNSYYPSLSQNQILIKLSLRRVGAGASLQLRSSVPAIDRSGVDSLMERLSLPVFPGHTAGSFVARPGRRFLHQTGFKREHCSLRMAVWLSHAGRQGVRSMSLHLAHTCSAVYRTTPVGDTDFMNIVSDESCQVNYRGSAILQQ